MENIWNLDFTTWWHFRLIGAIVSPLLILFIYLWRVRSTRVKAFLKEREQRKQPYA